MKVVLHIGTEKTGTSSIQSFLHANRASLLKFGYYYIATPGMNLLRELAAYALRDGVADDFFDNTAIKSIEQEKLFKKAFKERLIKEIEGMPEDVHTILVSCEHLHSRLNHIDEIVKIKEIFESYTDSFQILVYLRPQVEVAISRYSTILKSGTDTTSDIDQHLEDTLSLHSSWYDYSASLLRWSEVFGDESMTVRLFDKNRFFNSDLIDDYFYNIGERDVHKIKEVCTSPRIENESINSLGQDILLALNEVFKREECAGERANFVADVLKVVMELCSGKGRQPDIETVVKLESEFERSNELVRKRYFKDENKILVSDHDRYFSLKSKNEIVPKEIFRKTFSSVFDLVDVDLGRVVDLLRDAAISMENFHIESAYIFMSMARIHRPDGPLINEKLVSYREIIGVSTDLAEI